MGTGSDKSNVKPVSSLHSLFFRADVDSMSPEAVKITGSPGAKIGQHVFVAVPWKTAQNMCETVD